MQNGDRRNQHKHSRLGLWVVFFSVLGMISVTSGLFAMVLIPDLDLSTKVVEATTYEKPVEVIAAEQEEEREGKTFLSIYFGPTSFFARAEQSMRVAVSSMAQFVAIGEVYGQTNAALNIITIADTDLDGIIDTLDNCVYTPNTSQTDTDLDGVGDVCDNCQNTPNPGQLDSNSNCPVTPYLTDPLCGDACELPDQDNDGIVDSLDNCPTHANTSQNDADGDGFGNVCDNCWAVINNSQADTDNNCPAMPYVSDPLCGDACQLQCTDDSQCPSGEECVGGVCQLINCVDDNDCPGGYYCGPAGVCEVLGGECVVDSECELGEECVGGYCQIISCTDDADCPGGTECESGQCVVSPAECVNDSDCDVGEVCEDGVCTLFLCTSDEDCPSGTFCTEAGVCEEEPVVSPPAPPIECTDSAMCPAGEECVEGFCEAIPCEDDEECPGGTTCEEGICTPYLLQCVLDADCPAGEECVENVCLQIFCADNSDCPGGTYCTNEGICSIRLDGCASNLDCGLNEICISGSCVVVECVVDFDCLLGQVCEDNQCVYGYGGCLNNADCESNEVCVEGECVIAPPAECTDTCDCSEGFYCVEGSCEIRPECLDSLDCVQDEHCQAGACVTSENAVTCSNNDDCETAQICSAGYCEEVFDTICECRFNSDCENAECLGYECVERECYVSEQCEDNLSCLDGVCRSALYSPVVQESVKTELNRTLAEIFSSPYGFGLLRFFPEPVEVALPRVVRLVQEKIDPDSTYLETQLVLADRQVRIDQVSQYADVFKKNQWGFIFFSLEQFRHQVDVERNAIVEVRHPRLVGSSMKLSVNRLAVRPQRLRDLLLELASGRLAQAIGANQAYAQQEAYFTDYVEADGDGVMHSVIPVEELEKGTYGVFAIASKDGVDSDLVNLLRFQHKDRNWLTFTTWLVIILFTGATGFAAYSSTRAHIERRRELERKKLQETITD